MPRFGILSERATTGHRRRHAGLALLAALIALLLFALPAAAAQFRGGDSPDVPAGTTVNDDLYIVGRDVAIDGNVRGDVIVSATRLNVRGAIGGDLQAATGSTIIHGTVDRTVRVLSGNLSVYGTVGGDIIMAGGTLTVELGATVKGDIVAAGGDVTVRGQVNGDLRGNIGKLTIGGPVGGQVNVTTDRLHLETGARLAQSLEYRSRHALQRAAGAAVTGTISRSEPSRILPTDNFAVWLGSAILRVLFGLVAGVIVVLLLPRVSVSIAEGVRFAPLRSLIVGLILLILLPLLIIVLLITVIGIPIALLTLAFYVAALYLSQVFVGLAIGRFILPSGWDDAGRGFNLFAMVIGVVILGALRLIPLPYISWIIAAITAVLGLGAIFVGPRRGPRRTIRFGGKIPTS